MQAHFTLKEQNLQQHQKYVPIPLAQKQQVQHMLDDLHQAGVIAFQDTPSKIISNLICVKKPATQVRQEKQGKATSTPAAQSQSDLRLCLDLRLLNNSVVKTTNPMADVNELTTRLRDARMVSTLDISQAYNSICLTPEAVSYTHLTLPTICSV